jgi:hypothetical protein
MQQNRPAVFQPLLRDSTGEYFTCKQMDGFRLPAVDVQCKEHTPLLELPGCTEMDTLRSKPLGSRYHGRPAERPSSPKLDFRIFDGR